MIWAAFFLVTIAALIIVMSYLFPGVLGSDDARLELTHKILLLVLVGSSVVLGYRGRAGVAFKHGLAWIVIALILVIAYSFRNEAGMVKDRVLGELMPSRAIVNADGTVELRAGADGHFYADATVDGVPVRFLLDTGASIISLAPADARRIGFDPETLDHGRIVSTANGTASVAPVRLGRVQLGGITVDDIGASVHRDGLDQSLLGMNFLDRLGGFDRRGDRLILHSR